MRIVLKSSDDIRPAMELLNSSLISVTSGATIHEDGQSFGVVVLKDCAQGPQARIVLAKAGIEAK